MPKETYLTEGAKERIITLIQGGCNDLGEIAKTLKKEGFSNKIASVHVRNYLKRQLKKVSKKETTSSETSA